MNKHWDGDMGGRDEWISSMVEIYKECYRVMKPGAHGFVWALPRTSHWTATSLENAGFEIRDIVTHVFGSGFPKSYNISKGIDKKMGCEREVVGKSPYNNRDIRDRNLYDVKDGIEDKERVHFDITQPSHPMAIEWYRDWETDRKSTRLNSSHSAKSRMPSSA